MRLIYKIWLEKNQGRAFGEGPYRLLKGVISTGSLMQSASGMGMRTARPGGLYSAARENSGLPSSPERKEGRQDGEDRR
jgi:molybdate transport system regulatory protein